MKMTAQEVIRNIRNVPDFPVKGIQFKDITTALQNPDCLKWFRDRMVDLYSSKGVTKVLGIESRGFIIAPAVAMELNAGFVPIRKPGKLPAETIRQDFQKEYGTDTIEIHKDAINEDDVVLIHDDLLATGGTIKAAWELVKKFNPKKCYMNFIIEIRDEGLTGRENIGDGIEVTSLIRV